MGTPYRIDGRLNNLIDIFEVCTFELIELLKESYLEEEIKFGFFEDPKSKEFGLTYTLVDSEFEHVIYKFIYKHTDSVGLYELNLEMRYLDSPLEWKVSLNDSLISILPENMIKKMELEMDNLIEEKDS